MNYPEIKATIDEMTRYVDRNLKRRHTGGAYVRSTVIPRATKAELREAERRAGPDCVRTLHKKWVPVSYLVADQAMLLYDSLKYASRTYVYHQEQGEKLPTLVCVGRRRYFVWDGNHRCTIACMIGGDLYVQAYCVTRRPIRKKRLTRR
jgi:hypothetical protein